jgi:predicted membrane channel-forming protein YqfA (hemolysin III family)
MKLSWKARRRWALAILVLAVPAYIMAAVSVVALFERPSFLVELAVYVGLGILWVLPLKPIFKGISQPEPDDER